MPLFRHYGLTLTGVAQQLSDVLAAEEDDHPAVCISLEGDDGNADPVFVGGDNTVTATDYGMRVPGVRAAEPLTDQRIIRGVKLHLRDIWVFGTDAEILRIAVSNQ